MASILVKIVRICYSELKCNYLKNLKLFLDFFLHFWNVHQIWNILKKRMIVIANVFPKVQTVKNLLRPLSKKRCFITRLNSQHVKASEIPANTPWQRFYHVFSSFSRKLIPKMVPLELGEILVVFVNTLSGDAEVSHWRFWEFVTLNSNGFIWKTKIFFSTFCSISGIYIKF